MDLNKLAVLAEPLKNYLLDNFHQNCEIRITADNVKIVEIQESIPLSDCQR